MPSKGTSGFALSVAAAGAYLLYAGIKNVPPLDGLRSLLRGQVPVGTPSKPFLPLDDSPSGGSIPPVGTGSVDGGRIAAAAQSHIGTPYKWGGSSPAGMDCSGMVYYVFKHDLGYVGNFPRTTAAEILSPLFHKISRAEVGPGDLTWWPGHVGIAISNTQGVYAPHAGTSVQIQTIDRPRPGFVGLRFVGNFPGKVLP
jgi:NlpC/P60 family